MNLFSTKVTQNIDMSLVDFNGQYRINLLMNSFTNVAILNATQLGMWKQEMYGKYGWVVAKQTLKLSEPILMDDTIEIETMPGKGSFVAFPRYYFIYKDGKQIGECSSLWTLIDLEKRSIVNPKKIGLLFPTVDHGIKLPITKVASVDHMQLISNRKVSYEDIDTNGHLNNTRHIAWAYDLIDFDYLKSHTLKELNIQYKKEIQPSSLVDIYMLQQENTFYFEGRIDEEVYYSLQLIF